MLSCCDPFTNRIDFLTRHGFQIGIIPGEHFFKPGQFIAQRPHFRRSLGDRLQLGIFLRGLHKGITLERARRHPRLKLGKARLDLRNALGGDGGHRETMSETIFWIGAISSACASFDRTVQLGLPSSS